jgi:hypothetical protein
MGRLFRAVNNVQPFWFVVDQETAAPKDGVIAACAVHV